MPQVKIYDHLFTHNGTEIHVASRFQAGADYAKMAVTCHDDLVRALELAVPFLEAAARTERIRDRLTSSGSTLAIEALNFANAALVTVEGS